MKNFVTFRLTTGKKEGFYDLPKSVGVKTGGGIKLMAYREGETSIWEEDNKKSIIPIKNVTFQCNNVINDLACEITVPIENINLIEFLRLHPFNNQFYTEYSEEAEDKKALGKFDQIEKAFEIVRETNDNRIQATALAIFGIDVYGLSVDKCKAKLSQEAVENPSSIVEKYNDPNYESKFISALAFYSKIVRENNDISLVVWNDSFQNSIIPLAKGESGLAKLGEYFAEASLEAKTVVQEIYIRFEAKNKPTKTSKPKATADTAEKDLLIADLQAKLEALTANKIDVVDAQILSPGEPISIDDMDLATLRSEYIKKAKKELPPAQKNNAQWIKNYLKSN